MPLSTPHTTNTIYENNFPDRDIFAIIRPVFAFPIIHNSYSK
jgi:hypothetical protein